MPRIIKFTAIESRMLVVRGTLEGRMGGKEMGIYLIGTKFQFCKTKKF